MYLQAAFDAVLPDAQESDPWYVCLVERVPFYGGPEEGGWWGEDTNLISYREFPAREIADRAAERIRTLAGEMEDEARRNYGQQCLHQMEWLEQRGLGADYLPEPDGHSRFSVYLTQELPQNTRGCRHYE